MLFKGYVPTKEKKCMMKFKDSKPEELMTLEQVTGLPEYAGILAEDTALIDIDDLEQSEILMRIVEDKEIPCRVYETSRGKHFLFLNKERKLESCKTHTKLACGLTADIKLGIRNSYSVLKFNGKERKIIYDKFDEEEYSEVPKWLLPVKANTDFLEMEEGDGRNQSLFNYILTLQSEDFTDDEAKECIQIVNKYTMKEGLSDKELETVLRDESFKKPSFFGRGNVFYFDKFATYLKNQHHIVKINNQLHIYNEGIYIAGDWNIEAKMIEHIPNLNRQKRSEVMAYLNILINKNSAPSSANYIAFRNGILDIDKNELVEFSPNYIITNKIDFNYNPKAYSALGDRVLDKLACNDTNIRSLLEEVIGYCFYRRNELRKSFILIGGKANGKSTYLDIIKSILGDENTSALDLKELGDRFKTAELFGKLANIGDDIGDEFIGNPAVFKKVVSGDRLNAEMKGKNPFDFNNYSKMLFSANNIPRIKDKSGAVLDRLIIIPFNATFSKTDSDFDPYIKYKLREEECLEYFIRLAVEGLKRVLKRMDFTESEKVNKEIEEYEENNNPIIMFFKDSNENGVEFINESTKHVYSLYTQFCISNSFQPMSNIEFSKQVKKYYGYEVVNRTIKGRKYRVFVDKVLNHN